MSDLISRALLCGLGLASLTKDAIHKTVEDLVSKSKISEEEGKRLITELQQRSTKAQKTLEKEVDSAVHELLQHLNLPAIINDRLKGSKAAGTGARPTGKKTRKTSRRTGAAKAGKR